MKSRSYIFFLVVLLSLWTSKFVYAQQQETPIVRLIYFLPNDRKPQPDIEAKLDTLMEDVQQFYADMMEFHGFERKTFQYETDASGNVVVHHVTGQFTDKHYSSLSWTWDIWNEIEPRFDLSKNIYLTVIDMSNEYLDGNSAIYGKADTIGRQALISFGKHLEEDFGIAVTAHELGHAFGLLHDYRKNLKLGVDVYTTDPMISSYFTAEWLETNRFFNPPLPASNGPTNIKVLPPSTSSDNAIHLSFEISDPDGLHQVQLLVLSEGFGLIDSKGFNGESHRTAQFITTALTPKDKFIALNIIDGNGNIFRSPNYPIDVTILQSPDRVFSISDPNLEALVRSLANIPPNKPLTRKNTVFVLELSIQTEIKDFTGLEHLPSLDTLSIIGDGIISDFSKLSRLTQLRYLEISGNNNISDISPLAKFSQLKHLVLESNNISDVSPLASLTQLTHLYLADNNISDVSPLANLTTLMHLGLSENRISDITPLANLTNLEYLLLTYNQISDVSPLSELVNLRDLRLIGNPIKNKKPLFELLEKNPNVEIYLNNREPLPVNLSHFRAEHTHAGVILKWTTESEVDNAGFYIYRSTTMDGDFKVVNTTMIQGAGTTGERIEYTWTDTSAKPNTVYYYRIEDVSHAGVRKKLATVRLRGLVSASSKLTTRWAELKAEN